MPGDDYGVFGSSGDEDEYGVFGAPKPRRKKRPAARDVEAPESQKEEARAEEEEVFGKPQLAETRNEAAGPPEAAKLREGDGPSAWYEPLLKSALSTYQGITSNTLDDVAAGYIAAGDYLGLTHSGRTFDQNRARARELIDPATREYPVAHGAGQMMTGIAAGAALPATKLAQGAAQGVLSAASEYADSGEGWPTALAGAEGFASGVIGTAFGNRLARRFGVVDPVKNNLVRGNMTPAEMRGPTPDITARGGKALELVEELSHGAPIDPIEGKVVRGGMTPAEMAGAPDINVTQRGGRRLEALEALEELRGPDPFEGQIVRGNMTPAEMVGPTPNITARGGRPLSVREVPALETPRPQPNAPEMAYGTYDPLAGGTNPQPVAPASLPEATAAEAKDPIVRTALEMFTPTLQTRGTVEQLDDWMRQVIAHDLPPEAERALLGAWAKRINDVGPNVDAGRLVAEARLGNEFTEQAPRYALGELDAPKDTPRQLRNVFESPDAPSSWRPVEARRMPDAPVDPIDIPPAEPIPVERRTTLTARRAPQSPIEALELAPYTPQRGPTQSNWLTRRARDLPVEPIDIGEPSWDLASKAQRLAAEPPATLADKMLGAASHAPVIGKWARLGRAGKQLLTNPASPAEAGVYYNENARQIGRAGFEAGWELTPPLVSGKKVNAQEADGRAPVAYGDRNTLNYALSATLHAGNTGLSPEDEAQLTKAVVNGDQDAINAADFRLRQRYPAYARRIEGELRALNEGE